MMFLYQNNPIYLSGLSHQLGSVRRDLAALQQAGVLSNSVEVLAGIGYQHNYAVGPDENLLALAAPPLTFALARCSSPCALVFHHSYAENTCVPWAESDADLMSRGRYFPAALMKLFDLDHLPYFGSFASGCTGFLSLLIMAGSLMGASEEGSVICLTADIRPKGVTYDAPREKILTSDCGSGFLIGRAPRGYQLLGIKYYSTMRTLMPLVEIVKRTVQMTRELAQKLDLNLADGRVVIHYPNIFPEAWNMVTHYLKLSPEQHILDGMAERAHCLSSDSMITLAKWYHGDEGRLHIVVNFGSGLHLGVCILKEEKAHGPSL